VAEPSAPETEPSAPELEPSAPELEPPFSYSTRDGTVSIHWSGRLATVLRGKAAARFLARIEGRDAEAAQLEMARVTGNFRRGNERTGKQRERDRT
jgi:hypothetical protein